MRIEALTSHLPFVCPSSPEEFFSGKVSKNLGYIPAIGTVVGISRIIFSSYQYARGSPGWSQERFIQELIRDNEHKDAMGFSEERAKRLSRCTMTKDAPLAGKSLIQQLLQNCDSLAVLRADDWIFDPNYLDLLKWIRLNVPEEPDRQQVLEELNRVIDSTKTVLVYMGDSPFSMPCFSQARRGEVIQGNFSLSLKLVYEKSPRCYQMIQGHLRNDPILSRYV